MSQIFRRLAGCRLAGCRGAALAGCTTGLQLSKQLALGLAARITAIGLTDRLANFDRLAGCRFAASGLAALAGCATGLQLAEKLAFRCAAIVDRLTNFDRVAGRDRGTTISSSCLDGNAHHGKKRDEKNTCAIHSRNLHLTGTVTLRDLHSCRRYFSSHSPGPTASGRRDLQCITTPPFCLPVYCPVKALLDRLYGNNCKAMTVRLT